MAGGEYLHVMAALQAMRLSYSEARVVTTASVAPILVSAQSPPILVSAQSRALAQVVPAHIPAVTSHSMHNTPVTFFLHFTLLHPFPSLNIASPMNNNHRRTIIEPLSNTSP
jgi:hypothetical protein